MNMRGVMIVCGLLVCAGAASVSLAQTPCGVRSTWRIVTNMSGATGPGELYATGPWQVAAPAVGAGSITTTNTTGQVSSMTVEGRAEYGRLSLVASGAAQSGSGNGVFFWLDEYFGGAPKAESSDRLTISSATLPAGAPVEMRLTLTMEGSATLTDTSPSATFSALARMDNTGQPQVQLTTGVGTQTLVFTTFVGRNVTLYNALFATFRANGLLGGQERTASLSCDLRTRVTLEVLTAGVGISSCSGATYAPTPPCGSADFNNDGDVGTDADIEAFFSCLAGNCCAACQTADFNLDGDVGTDADIESFFRVLAGGAC